jgi:hypothetical protein
MKKFRATHSWANLCIRRLSSFFTRTSFRKPNRRFQPVFLVQLPAGKAESHSPLPVSREFWVFPFPLHELHSNMGTNRSCENVLHRKEIGNGLKQRICRFRSPPQKSEDGNFLTFLWGFVCEPGFTSEFFLKTDKGEAVNCR